MKNTLIVGLGTIALSVPLGTLLAILLVRTNLWGRSFAWLALNSQLVVPLYVFAGSWNAAFGSQGWWPLSQVAAARFETSALIAVIFIHSAASIPFVSMIVSLGLVWIDRSLEEVALLEGGFKQVIVRVLLPGLRPWLLLAAFWSLFPVLTEMVVTNLYQVPTLAEQVYLDASRGNVSPLTYPVALGLCQLPVLLLALWIHKLMPPWSQLIERTKQYRARTLPLYGLRLPISLAVWSIVLLLVALPIINLVTKAGWLPLERNGHTTYSWSINRFLVTLTESVVNFRSEFIWSLTLAVCSASAALALVILLLGFARKPWPKTVISSLMLLMIATPGALVGSLCIWLLNRSTPELLGYLYDHTLAAPILAQQFRLLPLAWLIGLSIMASIDRPSLELAGLDGLKFWQRLRIVYWPQTASRWLLGWLLLCILSLGELSATILVLPPGVTTLPMRLFELLHFGMRHQDSGLCLLLLAMGWLAAMAVWKTLKERNSFGSDVG